MSHAFEARRDLIASVENKWSGTIRSKYAYVNDPLGRRTNRVDSGTAFGSGQHEIYTYNARSELTSAKRYNGSDPNNPGAAVTGRHYTYAFDPIGNRDSYQIDTGTATTYVDNALNQYDRTTNGTTYEGFGYDADGNMTSDGTTTYEWDAENRLAAQYPTNHSANKIVWTYDYMNRRVWRRGYAWDANLNQYKSGTDTAFERKFLFDGWNNILILDGKAGDAANRSHTWGLDLSGSLHGAGGIGGLLSELAQWDGSNRKFIYCYDANGNVGQLLAVTDGSIASYYEYEPFGKPVVVTDPGNSGNSYFFSTRFLVNDLYYSSRRYENWRLGRWMSRDPMGERSGPSLYAFISNSPPNAVDPIGLEQSCNTCGVDITTQFDNVISAIESKFINLLPQEQAGVCRSMYSDDGWDIEEFYTAGGGLPFGGSATKSDGSIKPGLYSNPFQSGACGAPPCGGTVTYRGTCYYAAEMNYYLWGRMNRLCSDKKPGFSDFWLLYGGDYDAQGYHLWPWTYGYDAASRWVTLWRSGYIGRAFEWSDRPLRRAGVGVVDRQAWARAGWAGNAKLGTAGTSVTKCSPCATKYAKTLSAHVGNRSQPDGRQIEVTSGR